MYFSISEQSIRKKKLMIKFNATLRMLHDDFIEF